MSQPSPADVSPLRSATVPATPSSKLARASLLPRLLDFEHEHPIAAREIDGFQEFYVGRIFDHAARVPRREADVLNPGVGRIGRIKLAVDAADEMDISADLAERRAAERRPALDNLDPGD